MTESDVNRVPTSHAFGAEHAGQKHRSAQEGHGILVAGQFFGAEGERQMPFDLVTVLPGAGQGRIASGSAGSALGGAVDGGGLAFSQLRHQVIGLGFKRGVAGAGIQQRASTQVVAQRTTTLLTSGAVPAAVRGPRGGQAIVAAEDVQEAVRVEAQQVGFVAQHRILERAW
jgi:hypothetical protein